MPIPFYWTDHILVLVFCVLLPFFAMKQATAQREPVTYTSEQKKAFYFTTSFSLLLLALPVLAIWLIYGRPLSGIGIRMEAETGPAAWAIIAFIVLYTADVIHSVATAKNRAASVKELKRRTPFMPGSWKEFPAYVLMCLSAGIFEEIIYRGYLVTYFGQLFSSLDYRVFLAAAVPAFFFAVSHWYHGTKNIIKAFVLAVLLGYIFIESGSLLVVMLLHFLMNLVGGVLSVRLARDQRLA
jgi:membrane protease YdiL (CAAX protease family)